ncbi:MAG TPA: ATP-binding protein [Armatimonadota bacterium]|jgi:signal transduction histidine kinase
MGILVWTLLALSLFIVCLLGWLGCTILLTAERRHVYVWLISMAMLLGAAFVAFHAIAISHGFDTGNPLALSKWPLAWVMGLLLPGAWYMAMLWHVGFWENRRAMRHHWMHTAGFYGLLSLLGVAVLLACSDPAIRARPLLLLSSFDPAIILAGPYLGGMPVLALLYMILLLVCMGLALDVIFHPAPSRRLMGDHARERARPWLVVTTIVLLLISLLVCGSLVRFMPDMLFIDSNGLPPGTAYAMAWIDLAVAVLLAVATVLIGQAVVSYEIFTGKVLLRQGLRRRWLGAILLAGGFGVTLSCGVFLHIPTIFGALLVCALVMTLYALSVWRGFIEHERAVNNLRLFHTGPRLYSTMLAGESLPQEDAHAFQRLCAQMLEVEFAYLFPLGPLSSLVHPLTFPPDAQRPDSVAELVASFASPSTLCLPLNAGRYGGAIWAVPLWGERGLNGLFLLGAKRNHGLFTQEEVEIARAVGERFLDGLASSALASRLMGLQRTRMAEQQVVDQQTRRALHDEVLPQIHTTMLALSAGQLAPSAVVTQLTDIHRQIADILHAMPSASARDVTTKGLIGALHDVVERDLRGTFRAVRWEIDAAADANFTDLPPLTTEVLYGAAREAIRNAAKHAAGHDSAPAVQLRIAASCQDEVRLLIEDDGIGCDTPSASPMSTGHGVALHSTLMAVIGGAWETESQPGGYTRVTLTLSGSKPFSSLAARE